MKVECEWREEKERRKQAVWLEEKGSVDLYALQISPALHIIITVTLFFAFGLSTQIADTIPDVTSRSPAESESGRAFPPSSKIVQDLCTAPDTDHIHDFFVGMTTLPNLAGFSKPCLTCPIERA